MKINFGSFDTIEEGYVNVDHALRYIIPSRCFPACVVLSKLGIISNDKLKKIKNFKCVNYADMRKHLKWDDSSIDKILVDNSLEHLYYKEAISFLKECRRILIEDGIIKIIVPDFNDLVHTGKNDFDIMDQLYAKSKKYQKIGHKWMYTERYLNKILTLLKFTVIKSSVDSGMLTVIAKKENCV